MKISGTVSVACPVCGAVAQHELLQTVNANEQPEAVEQLLRGELNVAACACGKRTQLAANFVYTDPESQLVIHVCPDGEAAMQRAEAAFAASYGAAGQGEAAAARAAEDSLAASAPRAGQGAVQGAGQGAVQRVVPSMNALVEKVKISDADLQDWAVEMLKVLLLASLSIDDDDRVLLFSHVDRDAGSIRWLLFDRFGEDPSSMSSPLAAYDRLLATAGAGAAAGYRRIDRAWAIEAVRSMIASGN